MKPRDHLLITCEHGGNRVPARYAVCFRGHEALLHGHRGYDPGALTLARQLSRTFAAPLFYSTTSRLLIDLNRSIGHARLYSEATRVLPGPVREAILKRHYLPYRQRVEAHIASVLAKGGRVIHISSHSFTPVLEGEVRKADIGLLYDPRRPGEVALCQRWRKAILDVAVTLAVRRNYPYTGKSDGFTAYLRRRFSAAEYVGIELEVNQRYALPGGRPWREVREILVTALQRAL